MTERDRGTSVQDREQAAALRGSHDEHTFSEAIEQTERERERAGMRRRFNEAVSAVREISRALEAGRERQAKEVRRIEAERNIIRSGFRRNPETCHKSVELLRQEDAKALATWSLGTRTYDAASPPDLAVIRGFLFEHMDFGDYLSKGLDDAIATNGEAFDSRSTKQLKKLNTEIDAKLEAARDELELRDKAAKKAAAAVHAAENRRSQDRREVSQRQKGPSSMTDENPWAEHDARLRAEEEQQAKKAGVSVEDFRAAKHVGMEPVEFAAWRGVNTAADAAAVEDELKASAEARAQATKQAAVERERARL